MYIYRVFLKEWCNKELEYRHNGARYLNFVKSIICRIFPSFITCIWYASNLRDSVIIQNVIPDICRFLWPIESGVWQCYTMPKIARECHTLPEKLTRFLHTLPEIDSRDVTNVAIITRVACAPGSVGDYMNWKFRIRLNLQLAPKRQHLQTPR